MSKTPTTGQRNIPLLARWLMIGLCVLGCHGLAKADLGEAIVLDSDAVLVGQRATAWRDIDGNMYVLLEGNTEVSIGAYGFRAQRAVVRIISEQQIGQTVRHLWVYLDEGRSTNQAVTAYSRSKRLLVTGSITGKLNLEADVLTTKDITPGSAFVTDALIRFDQQASRLATAPFDIDEAIARSEQAGQELSEAREAGAQTVDDYREQTRVDLPEIQTRQTSILETPVLPRNGIVRFRADRLDARKIDDEIVVMLVGDVTILYQDRDRDLSTTLKAERAVVMLGDENDQAMGGEVDASSVTGIYLEDNAVASDGNYTVRAPRVFYDLPRNRAVLLEAVMYTFDVNRELPLYVRADMMRQTSKGTFEAEQAQLTTSEFGVPHFAIGASKVTVRQIEPEIGQQQAAFSADNVTMRVNDTPVFWLPYVAGRTGDVPLRSARASYSSKDGAIVETTWEVMALLGKTKKEGFDIEGRLDFQGEHLVGLGGEVTYDRPGLFGSIETYILPYDNGDDEISGRRDIDFDGEFRGFITSEHRQEIGGNWELSLRGDYVTDESFLEAFFPDEAYESQPYEVSAYLKWQEEDQAFTALAKANANNFLPQLADLQAPGSVTDRFPEISYWRTGTPMLDGRVIWFSENRIGALRQRFGDDRPSDRGFSDSRAMRLFGIDSSTRFVDAAEAMGLDEDVHFRFDSRQEISVPFAFENFNLTPYAVGRLTAYETDFEKFSGQDDLFRAQGIVGTRFDTSFYREYSGVRSDLFDVDGLRHIMVPSVDAFWIFSNTDAGDWPIFDSDVEGLAEGGGLRLGLLQTLETRRGGPGRYRTVDWIQLRTDLVIREDNDFDEEAPLARYVSYRPEYAVGGDHGYVELLYLVTDNLGLVSEFTYNIEDSEIAQWRVGSTYRHGDRLRATLAYTEIEAIPSQVLGFDVTYQLTLKYLVGFAQSYDFADNDEDSAQTSVFFERQLPRWRLRVFGSFDELDDDVTVGILLAPDGIDSASGFRF